MFVYLFLFHTAKYAIFNFKKVKKSYTFKEFSKELYFFDKLFSRSKFIFFILNILGVLKLKVSYLQCRSNI